MSPIRLAYIAALIALAGCASTVTSPVSVPVTASTAARDLATLQAGAAAGQLFCQSGPAVLGLFDPSGAALLAKGAPKRMVDAACNLVGGAAVALSDVSVTPAGVVVTLPPSITVPTRKIG